MRDVHGKRDGEHNGANDPAGVGGMAPAHASDHVSGHGSPTAATLAATLPGLIHLRILLPWRPVEESIRVNGPLTVGTALHGIAMDEPEDHCLYILNGKACTLHDHAYPGDEVIVLPYLGGG